jgi:hypothetical protein
MPELLPRFAAKYTEETAVTDTGDVEGKLRRCPYCMQMKPVRGFTGGICQDCTDLYQKSVKKSIKDGKLIAKKAEIQEALEGVAMLASVFTRFPVDASPEDDNPETPHDSAPARVVWKRILIALGITLAIPACYIAIYFILKAISAYK